MSPLAHQSWAQSLVVPLFITFAASGILPLWNGVNLYGWQRMDQLAGLPWVLAHGAIYLAGVGYFIVCYSLAQEPHTFLILNECRRSFPSVGGQARSIRGCLLISSFTSQ